MRELKTAAGDVLLSPATSSLDIPTLILNLNLYVVSPAIFRSSFLVQGVAINRKTVQAFGLTIPMRVDRVFERIGE